MLTRGGSQLLDLHRELRQLSAERRHQVRERLGLESEPRALGAQLHPAGEPLWIQAPDDDVRRLARQVRVGLLARSVHQHQHRGG